MIELTHEKDGTWVLTKRRHPGGIPRSTPLDDDEVATLRKLLAVRAVAPTAQVRQARERDQEILHLLRVRGPLTKSELAALLGVSDDQAYNGLWRLKVAGQVAADPNNGHEAPQYRLVKGRAS